MEEEVSYSARQGLQIVNIHRRTDQLTADALSKYFGIRSGCKV